LKTIDKKEIYKFYTMGWRDAHTGNYAEHIIDEMNKYAYELGIIDFIFSFDAASENRVEQLIKEKFN
tara:strand:- start:264 stop:464 length:201 start_codon:yes stop_codon:yes gene_type:complete